MTKFRIKTNCKMIGTTINEIGKRLKQVQWYMEKYNLPHHLAVDIVASNIKLIDALKYMKEGEL